MARTGRPSRLTREFIGEFAGVLGCCWHLETACDLVGISKQSVYVWLRKGRKAKRGLHREFRDAVKKALAGKAALAVAGIEKAGQGGCWTAYAWLLERKYPELWSSSVNEIREIRRWIEQQERAKSHGQPHHPTPEAFGANGTCPRPLA
jgi:hypothetical protein